MKWVSFLFSLMFWATLHIFWIRSTGSSNFCTPGLCEKSENLVAWQVLTEFEFYMLNVSCTWYMADVVPWSGGIASRNPDEVLVQVESLMCSPPFLLPFLFFLPLSSSVLFLQPPFLCCSLSSMSSHVIEICIRREHAEGSKVFGYLWNQWRTKKQAQRIRLIVSLDMSASPPFWKNMGTLVGVSINISMSILGNIIDTIESFTRNES